MVKLITKQDFLNYFKKPYVFWFLSNREVDNFFIDEVVLEQIEELEFNDLSQLLKSIDSPENLFFDNYIKTKKILDNHLRHFYSNKFKIHYLNFYDHTLYGSEDSTQRFLSALEKDKDVFIFKPNITSGDLRITPTAVYKYKGKIYVFEHVWSSTLKKELLGSFIYYDYVFKSLNIPVAQFLVSYLSNKPSPNKEVKIEITNSLPFKAKKYSPTDPLDPKLKNINVYFGMENLQYREGIYEVLFNLKEFDSFNNEDWEEEPIYVDSVLRELRDFLKNPVRKKEDFLEIAKSFLSHKKSIISPPADWFKFYFHKLFPQSSFSSVVIPFDSLLKKIMRYENQEKRDYFLNYVYNLEHLQFNPDQPFHVFEEAVEKFKSFTKKKVKVYYDFETISLPFPYLENTKPYSQLVLQISLLKLVDGKEKDKVNWIIDPLELSVDHFKKLIDLIYTDEIDVAYVVYNKSFENTRLKEMAALIGDPSYAEKVVSIIDRTVDLADWFVYGNKPHIIHRDLRGFHSIKKLIKLIPQEFLDKSKTVQYSDLDKCQNGVMAQALLISRALSFANPDLDKSNWEKNKHFMYLYCENDVRSMWAVEMFIDHLLKSNKYDFFDPEKYLDVKLNIRKK